MIGNRAFTTLMVGWLLTSAVQAKPRPGDIAGVYPSAGPGDRKLYAIARVNPGAGPATTRSGESIIQVFVTGRDCRVEGTAASKGPPVTTLRCRGTCLRACDSTRSTRHRVPITSSILTAGSTRSNGLGSGYGRAACVLKGWFWYAPASYR